MKKNASELVGDSFGEMLGELLVLLERQIKQALVVPIAGASLWALWNAIGPASIGGCPLSLLCAIAIASGLRALLPRPVTEIVPRPTPEEMSLIRDGESVQPLLRIVRPEPDPDQ